MTKLQEGLKGVKEATVELVRATEEQIDEVLLKLAKLIEDNQDKILQENKKDLDEYPDQGPKYQRLKLDEKKLNGIAESLREVVELPSPLGQLLEQRQMPSGLDVQRVSVPLGVVGMIYESRPNVTVDAFALCFKAGNGCVLKGGSDAKRSNQVFVEFIRQALQSQGFSSNLVYLLPPGRESVQELFQAHGLVDVIIPRGSSGLINLVRENSKIPVIETGAGVCHVFVDETAEVEVARRIVKDSKTSRPFACNALDTLLVHRDQLVNLAEICGDLPSFDVQIFADGRSKQALEGSYPSNLLHVAEEENFGQEYLGYAMAVKVVDDLGEAMKHIRQHSSGHSESIVSQDKRNIEKFLRQVDAAAVYANTSLAFTDGGQFGLGAEIGISTQKLHARGPFALQGLTSYKWVVRSQGAVRG